MCPGDANCWCDYYDSGRLMTVNVDYNHDGYADEQWNYTQSGHLIADHDDDQEDVEGGAWDVGLNVAFVLGFPMGELAENIDNLGFGFDFTGSVRMADSPLELGLHFGFLNYGSETRREPFSTTIPDVYLNVHTNNHITYGHFFVRLRTDIDILQPYLDGLIGFGQFATTTSIESDYSGYDDDDNIASTTNFDDFAWSYGVGFGVNIEVIEGGSGRGFINLGGRYLLGGEAEYLLEGSITETAAGLTYDVSRSETDMFMAQIGFTYQF